jgi:flagellar protein FlgJ
MTLKERQEFIATIAPAAVACMKATGIPASTILAQAILETGWGGSVKGHNWFGIKATGRMARIIRAALEAGTYMESMVPEDMQVLWTHEYVTVAGTTKRRKVRIRDVFRRYANDEESFEDHSRLFLTAPRYREAMRVTADPREFLRRVQAAGYSTAPTYADNCIALIDKYKLDQYDVIQEG